MLLKQLRLCFAFLILATCARAQSVTFQFGADNLRASNGSFVGTDTLVLLLANVGTSSTAGAGFNTLLSPGSLSVGSMLGSYQILGRVGTGGLLDPQSAYGQTDSLQMGGSTFPNLSSGDQLAIAWFPTLSFTTGTSLTAGTSYGLYTQNSSSAWQVPASTLTPFELLAPANLAASLSAIPEPSTYAAIFGAASLTFAASRRSRQRRATR